ncbi:hypothetical protein K4K52_012669 [Colletotrichum sp. SAR 10_76]|nr:hypothetical protein K4K52_012669 [Colletotrichum sp. SAR 10_76]
MAQKPPKKPLKLITASSHDGLRSLDAGAKWDEVEDLMSPGTAAALVVIANPSSWGDSPLNIQTRVYEIEETYPSLMGSVSGSVSGSMAGSAAASPGLSEYPDTPSRMPFDYLRRRQDETWKVSRPANPALASLPPPASLAPAAVLVPSGPPPGMVRSGSASAAVGISRNPHTPHRQTASVFGQLLLPHSPLPLPNKVAEGYSEPARPNELSPTAVRNHQFSTQPRQQSFTAGISDMRQMAPKPPASQPVANAADAAELAKIEDDYYNALDRWEKIMQSAVAAEGELLRLEHRGVALRAALDPSAPAPPAPWDTAVASGVLPIPFNLAGSAKQKRSRQRTRNKGGGPAVEEDVL